MLHKSVSISIFDINDAPEKIGKQCIFLSTNKGFP